MHKYHEVIRNLSLDEKIDLIISSNRCGNKAIDNYELPIIMSNNNPLFLTQNNLETFHYLGYTWNQQLINDLGKSIGKANRNQMVNISMYDSSNESFFSSNDFLSGKIAGNLLKGIENEGALTSLSCLPDVKLDKQNYYLHELESFDTALKMSSPFLIETTNPKIKNLSQKLGYSGYVSYLPTEPNTIVEALYNEALLITTENKDEILKAIDSYKEHQRLLENGDITKAYFNDLERKGIIFDENRLDQLVENVLEALASYDEVTRKAICEANFDLENYYNETILMLKNENALPLDTEKCLWIGDLFNKILFDEKSTLDIIPDYLSTTNSFARGYYDGIDPNGIFEPIRDELVSDEDNKFVLLVEAIDGNISDEAKKLIQNIINENIKEKKIILIVVGNELPNVKLDNFCDALLYIPKLSREYVITLLQTLKGINNPSARVSRLVYDQTQEEKKPIYPLGYGISYSKFIYSNERLTKTYVKVTVENSSIYDGYQVLQLYSKCPFEETLRLAGFKKIFLHAGEKQVFYIPLDDKAFRYYDEDKDLYGIKKGIYEVYLGENMDDLYWSGEVELDDYLHDENEFTDEYVGDCDLNGLTDFTNSSSKFDVNMKYEMSFGKKLTIGILLDLYFTLMFVFILVLNLQQTTDNSLFVPIFMSALAVLSNVVFFIFLAIQLKKRKKTTKEFKTAKDLLEKTNRFNELAHVSYSVPMVEEKEEETIESVPEESICEEEVTLETNEEEAIEEIKEDITVSETEDDEYDDSYVATPIVYEFKDNYQTLSLDDLCLKFNSFALESGYLLELPQIRILLAAVLSNQLIFIKSNNKEHLVHVLALLDRFFGNELHPVNVAPDTVKMKDILWNALDDKFVYSDFTIDLLKSKNNQNGLKLFVLNNVNMENFPKYFYKFLNQAKAPKLPQYIKLEKTYQLPNNVCYIIIPNQDDYMDLASFKLLESALSLYLNIGVTDMKEVEIEPVSYAKLVEQLDEAKATYYLSEDDWKKIDDLEDEINQRDPMYYHSNTSALLIERLCTTLLTFDSERYLLDDILTAYYVPLLKTTGFYKKANGDFDTKEILNQIFGSENIPEAIKLLPKKVIVTNDEVHEVDEVTTSVTEEDLAEENVIEETLVENTIEVIEETKEDLVEDESNSDEKPLENNVEIEANVNEGLDESKDEAQ